MWLDHDMHAVFIFLGKARCACFGL